jgi:thiol-disulfide isomerase/thioredoxin
VTIQRTLFAFLLTAGLVIALDAQAESDSTQRYVLDIQGMTCSGCASTVHETLLSSKGISSAVVSHLQGKACIETSGSFDETIVGAALAAAEYKMTGHLAVEKCPDGLSGKLPDPWEEHSEGLRVKTVSQGEEIDLAAQIVDDSYTIIDFGAPWCGPCHEAAEQLAAYLTKHADVAVRAINLAGQEPADSYQQPIVAQHLQYVKGVPWFIIHAPGGKVLYRGMEVGKAMRAIDKHRKRAAKRSK